MDNISLVGGRKILDSRGSWTLEAYVGLQDGSAAYASVPQGKSMGSLEASSLPIDKAVETINAGILQSLNGISVSDQKKIDQTLNELDGTTNKSKIGGNVILAVSIACARLAAIKQGLPLWKYIRQYYGLPALDGVHPSLYMNVINGGLHAGGGAKFQEYLVIPKANSLAEAIQHGLDLYERLGLVIAEKYGRNGTNTGDEGGYVPLVTDDEDPLRMIMKSAEAAGIADKISLGLDSAASNINLSSDELMNWYNGIINRYPVAFIEDPFDENDFISFANMLSKFGDKVVIAGDDLTVTQTARMNIAHEKKSVNGMIVKPNQVGTISETIDSINLARKFNWKIVVSHRSGETNDDFIADLAYACCADGFKLGAPARGERIAKFNRLLEIEASVKAQAK